MIQIWSWMFRRRGENKLLTSLEKKARENPQDWQVQVRLGELLAKMGKKKAAIEVYHHAAENFADRGLMIEATAICNVIVRLDPLQREILQRVSKLYAEWDALKGEKRTLENDTGTNHGFGE
jgi:hypothetical protein